MWKTKGVAAAGGGGGVERETENDGLFNFI